MILISKLYNFTAHAFRQTKEVNLSPSLSLQRYAIVELLIISKRLLFSFFLYTQNGFVKNHSSIVSFLEEEKKSIDKKRIKTKS